MSYNLFHNSDHVWRLFNQDRHWHSRDGNVLISEMHLEHIKNTIEWIKLHRKKLWKRYCEGSIIVHRDDLTLLKTSLDNLSKSADSLLKTPLVESLKREVARLDPIRQNHSVDFGASAGDVEKSFHHWVICALRDKQTLNVGRKVGYLASVEFGRVYLRTVFPSYSFGPDSVYQPVSWSDLEKTWRQTIAK